MKTNPQELKKLAQAAPTGTMEISSGDPASVYALTSDGKMNKFWFKIYTQHGQCTEAEVAALANYIAAAAPDAMLELIKSLEAWKEEAESLRRARDDLREKLDLRVLHQEKDVWFWQGDSTDCPESMGNSMVVVIRADQLRALVSQERQPQEPAPERLHLPENGAYIIRYDDTAREDEFFAMHGARDAALYRFKQISGNWNAHLFVKIDSNSRDVECPSAEVHPVPDDDQLCAPCSAKLATVIDTVNAKKGAMSEDERAAVDFFYRNPSAALLAFDRLPRTAQPQTPVTSVTDHDVHTWAQNSTIAHHIEPDGAHIHKRYRYVAERAFEAGAAQHEADRRDAARYRWLRERDLDTIDRGGLFVGLTPDNIVVTQEDLDVAIDAAMAKEANTAAHS